MIVGVKCKNCNYNNDVKIEQLGEGFKKTTFKCRNCGEEHIVWVKNDLIMCALKQAKIEGGGAGVKWTA